MEKNPRKYGKTILKIGAVFASVLILKNSYMLVKTENNLKELKNEQIAYLGKETVEVYEEYIKEIGDKLSYLADYHPLFTSSYLTCLLNDGVFSAGSIASSYNGKYIDAYSYLGLDVVNGIATCRHKAAFICDVLDELGYDARTISCNHANDPALLTDNPDYMVIYINYKNLDYLVDPTNDTFYVKEDDHWVDPDKNNYIKLLPKFGYLILENDLKELCGDYIVNSAPLVENEDIAYQEYINGKMLYEDNILEQEEVEDSFFKSKIKIYGEIKRNVGSYKD